jgi:hypothetical protein
MIYPIAAHRSAKPVRVLSCWEGAQDVAIFAAYPRTTQVAPNVPAFVRYLAVVYDAAPPLTMAV